MFSIVMPMDINRIEQFAKTKAAYDAMPERKEFIIPTRTDELSEELSKRRLMKDVLVIRYKHEIGFNPSKAFNIGVRQAQYDNIIITSPEVKPNRDVLEKLKECVGQNIVCQVHDQDENGNLTCLVSKDYRGDTPAMYFLAMFNKNDIETINGWDEEFMRGYAYEDNDFGDRWVRAGLPFEVREDIQATHLYHPRSETIPGGLTTNLQTYQSNNANGVTKCANGLVKL